MTLDSRPIIPMAASRTAKTSSLTARNRERIFSGFERCRSKFRSSDINTIRRISGSGSPTPTDRSLSMTSLTTCIAWLLVWLMIGSWTKSWQDVSADAFRISGLSFSTYVIATSRTNSLSMWPNKGRQLLREMKELAVTHLQNRSFRGYVAQVQLRSRPGPVVESQFPFRKVLVPACCQDSLEA